MGPGHPGVHGVPADGVRTAARGRPGHGVRVPGRHPGVRIPAGGREEVEGVVQGELRRPEHQHHEVEAVPSAAQEQCPLRGQGEEQEAEHPRAGQTSARRDMAHRAEQQAGRAAEQAPGRSPRQAARCTHRHEVAGRPAWLGGGLGTAVSSHGAVVGPVAEKVPACVLNLFARAPVRESARTGVASPTVRPARATGPGGVFPYRRGGAGRPVTPRPHRAVTGISFCTARGAGTLVGSRGTPPTPYEQRDAMTATTAAGNARHARRARTGGPEDGSKLMEHIAGWAFVVVFAMLVTQIGLL